MSDQLFAYLHAVSQLEGLNPEEELSEYFEDVTNQYTSAEDSGLINGREVTGRGLVEAAEFEENSNLLDYEFSEPVLDFVDIIEKAETVSEDNTSFTSGGLPEGFERESDDGPRGFDETSFTETKNYENSSLTVRYGERTSFGFGGSETGRIEVELEGLLEADYDNSWSLQ